MSVESGARFEPTDNKRASIMVDLLNLKPGETAVDLGSGNGQVIMEMARRGAYGHGFELDTSLIKIAQSTIDEKHLNHAVIYQANFWEAVTQYYKIAVFQSPDVMTRLEHIFLTKCKNGTHIVSHRWPFPNIEPVQRVGDIYLYVKGLSQIKEPLFPVH
jgi:cyclopropane fatty-acyl-phospholipid synthase-like methyltransferase